MQRLLPERIVLHYSCAAFVQSFFFLLISSLAAVQLERNHDKLMQASERGIKRFCARMTTTTKLVAIIQFAVLGDGDAELVLLVLQLHGLLSRSSCSLVAC
jgi:hypothetical protein